MLGFNERNLEMERMMINGRPSIDLLLETFRNIMNHRRNELHVYWLAQINFVEIASWYWFIMNITMDDVMDIAKREAGLGRGT